MSGNATIADYMKDWFLSFAIDLDPTSQSWSGLKKPGWETYQDPQRNNYLVMSVNYTEVSMVDDKFYDQTERCKFLWEHGDIMQN